MKFIDNHAPKERCRVDLSPIIACTSNRDCCCRIVANSSQIITSFTVARIKHSETFTNFHAYFGSQFIPRSTFP